MEFRKSSENGKIWIKGEKKDSREIMGIMENGETGKKEEIWEI